MDQPLTRDAFREGVFSRDQHRCVWCGEEGADAHHLLERRLFGPSKGYYLDNGVTVCNACHLKAEMTTLSVEDLRKAAGISSVVSFDKEGESAYDKWGNPILSDGNRCIGELFYEEPVQKMLRQGNVMSTFTTNLVKYPRTFHFPWSLGTTSDDRILADTDHFQGKEVVVTEKMDGEGSSVYQDHTHARSVDSQNHPSRNWLKTFHASFCHDIPAGWRICGESMYAQHSLTYDQLPSFFLVFSIWDEKNEALSWDDTVEWCNLLGLIHVPVLWRGVYDEEAIKELWSPGKGSAFGPEMEGYVVRIADSFPYSAFDVSVGKMVRASHVQTNDHWSTHWVPNKLRQED